MLPQLLCACAQDIRALLQFQQLHPWCFVTKSDHTPDAWNRFIIASISCTSQPKCLEHTCGNSCGSAAIYMVCNVTLFRMHNLEQLHTVFTNTIPCTTSCSHVAVCMWPDHAAFLGHATDLCWWHAFTDESEGMCFPQFAMNSSLPFLFTLLCQ